jgi:hypothetical protein
MRHLAVARWLDVEDVMKREVVRGREGPAKNPSLAHIRPASTFEKPKPLSDWRGSCRESWRLGAADAFDFFAKVFGFTSMPSLLQHSALN